MKRIAVLVLIIIIVISGVMIVYASLNDISLQETIKTIFHYDLEAVKETPDAENDIIIEHLQPVKPEIVENLDCIEIENLNDESNSIVKLELPEGWSARKLIFEKASNFEFKSEKNKKIEKVYTFEIYNSIKPEKFNTYGVEGLAGEFYAQQAYYRDQPESTRFPNHSVLKSKVYKGETILGDGEIFILDHDLPRDMRTEKFSTYDMIFVWIPIKGEDLAYSLSISVPVGENSEEYIEMVKGMLGKYECCKRNAGS